MFWSRPRAGRSLRREWPWCECVSASREGAALGTDGRDGSGAGGVSRQGVKEPGLGDRLGCSLVLQPEREVWGWLE